MPASPTAVVASLWRLCIGYCISLAIGVPLGLLLGRLRLLDDMALVMASMLIIMVIGLIADRLIFRAGEQFVHKRWGVG